MLKKLGLHLCTRALQPTGICKGIQGLSDRIQDRGRQTTWCRPQTTQYGVKWAEFLAPRHQLIPVSWKFNGDGGPEFPKALFYDTHHQVLDQRRLQAITISGQKQNEHNIVS